MTDVPTFVRAVLFCPDCEAFHDLQVIVHAGRTADQIAIGSGPGSGYLYSLTLEDHGEAEGVSIPVYRSIGRVDGMGIPEGMEAAKLLALARRIH